MDSSATKTDAYMNISEKIYAGRNKRGRICGAV